MGIVVIWLAAAIVVPLVPSVTLVESFYAFGFVSAFIITSTTVFFVRDDVLTSRGIQPGSNQAKTLRFAGLRGMVASYLMGIVLVTQKTDALPPIVLIATVLTLFQYFVHRGGLRTIFPVTKDDIVASRLPGRARLYASGDERSLDEARQHGIAELVDMLIEKGAMVKFNVEPESIRRLVSYEYDILPITWEETREAHYHGERFEEPSLHLEKAYWDACAREQEIMATIEHFSHYGIFTFVNKYYHNWVSEHRSVETVQRQMLRVLFPRTPLEEIWQEFQNYQWTHQPEEVWQFIRKRYQWAKDQWPNLSGRVTTIWTLQDLGILNGQQSDLVQKLLDARPVPLAIDKQAEIHERLRLKEMQGSHEDADAVDTVEPLPDETGEPANDSDAPASDSPPDEDDPVQD